MSIYYGGLGRKVSHIFLHCTLLFRIYILLFFLFSLRHERYPNEPAFIIPECLKEKVASGDLGRKSGKGFYEWKGERRGDPVE